MTPEELALAGAAPPSVANPAAAAPVSRLEQRGLTEAQQADIVRVLSSQGHTQFVPGAQVPSYQDLGFAQEIAAMLQRPAQPRVTPSMWTEPFSLPPPPTPPPTPPPIRRPVPFDPASRHR